MSEICPNCGLPKELCVCETIAKEQQKIQVKIEKRKFGKKYTIITGLKGEDLDLEDVAKKLKTKLACGGTAKKGQIELQGDHRSRVKEVLTDLGFPEEQIEIS